eukprot:TRINITY_DN6382_c1_g1_i1.p1 TRINITY_DN6382_c1_g1~~TRINITY_DN6382_c1_g1_i1.p1  ORF type:complete len:813 (+),score=132.32 TRINITY_DN6382_c1_g1_i1:352-2439(+)
MVQPPPTRRVASRSPPPRGAGTARLPTLLALSPPQPCQLPGTLRSAPLGCRQAAPAAPAAASPVAPSSASAAAHGSPLATPGEVYGRSPLGATNRGLVRAHARTPSPSLYASAPVLPTMPGLQASQSPLARPVAISAGSPGHAAQPSRAATSPSPMPSPYTQEGPGSSARAFSPGRLGLRFSGGSGAGRAGSPEAVVRAAAAAAAPMTAAATAATAATAAAAAAAAAGGLPSSRPAAPASGQPAVPMIVALSGGRRCPWGPPRSLATAQVPQRPCVAASARSSASAAAPAATGSVPRVAPAAAGAPGAYGSLTSAISSASLTTMTSVHRQSSGGRGGSSTARSIRALSPGMGPPPTPKGAAGAAVAGAPSKLAAGAGASGGRQCFQRKLVPVLTQGRRMSNGALPSPSPSTCDDVGASEDLASHRSQSPIERRAKSAVWYRPAGLGGADHYPERTASVASTGSWMRVSDSESPKKIATTESRSADEVVHLGEHCQESNDGAAGNLTTFMHSNPAERGSPECAAGPDVSGAPGWRHINTEPAGGWKPGGGDSARDDSVRRPGRLYDETIRQSQRFATPDRSTERQSPGRSSSGERSWSVQGSAVVGARSHLSPRAPVHDQDSSRDMEVPPMPVETTCEHLGVHDTSGGCAGYAVVYAEKGDGHEVVEEFFDSAGGDAAAGHAASGRTNHVLVRQKS